MPAKYHIDAKAVPPRFRPVGKLGIVDWREDCASCHNCVKKGCVYGFYRNEADTLHDQPGYLDYIFQCKGCLTCVQNCTKGILSRVINPEYARLGDKYYTPQIIQTTWFQAEAGAIPVSGAGYGGPFSGPGFDSMWTDMSEIVRPTRDGIHGREYINTSVDIGRRVGSLAFEGEGLTTVTPPLIENPVPLIFDVIPERFQRGPVMGAMLKAAEKMGVFMVMREREIPEGGPAKVIVPFVEGTKADILKTEQRGAAALVMIDDCPEIGAICAALKKENAGRLVAIRVKASPQAAARVLELTRGGAEVIHLVFDAHGREDCGQSGLSGQGGQSGPRHARDVLREVHGTLVKAGLRDQVTLVTSGGIALPEHMAKAIICGADLVAVDLPLIIALECRLCGECERGEECPIALEEIGESKAMQRIINLISSWRNQLLEMLGAMGIREVRRLRGETGRSMFFEDLERNTFGRLFGKRKDGAE